MGGGGETYKHHFEVVPPQRSRRVVPREAVPVSDEPAHHARHQQDPREDAENIDERDAGRDLFGMFALGRDGGDSSRGWFAVAESGVFRCHWWLRLWVVGGCDCCEAQPGGIKTYVT